MRKIVLVLSLIASCYLGYRAFYGWSDMKQLENQNLILKKEVIQYKDKIKKIEALDDQPLVDLQESYKRINTKIRLFSRSNDFKTTLDFNKSNKRGFLSEVEEDSLWIGVKQMTVDIKYFEIKSLDQFMSIIGFLDTLEASNYLKVLSIYQAGDSLQAKVQIYGRGI